MFSFTALENQYGKNLPAGKSIFMAISTIALAFTIIALLASPVSAQDKIQEEKQVKNPAEKTAPPAALMGPLPESEMLLLQKTKPKQKSSTDLLDRKLRQLDNVYVPIHWSDPRSGLAIGGHDPISYFEFQKRMNGNDDFQLVWHGVAWRFKTSGNMKMFKKSPSSYAPAYAGYDPYSVSQGVMAAGKPSVWGVIRGHLYLFHNQVNRYLWQQKFNELYSKAQKNWPELSSDIPRYKIIQSTKHQLPMRRMQ